MLMNDGSMLDLVSPCPLFDVSISIGHALASAFSSIPFFPYCSVILTSSTSQVFLLGSLALIHYQSNLSILSFLYCQFSCITLFTSGNAKACTDLLIKTVQAPEAALFAHLSKGKHKVVKVGGHDVCRDSSVCEHTVQHQLIFLAQLDQRCEE